MVSQCLFSPFSVPSFSSTLLHTACLSVCLSVFHGRDAMVREGDFLGEASFVSNRKGPRSVTAICS